MPCPTCRGAGRHKCALCEPSGIPPHLGGDPLDGYEPCPRCVPCSLGIPRPVPAQRRGWACESMRRAGVGWPKIAAVVYGDAAPDSLKKAQWAANNYRQRRP